MADPMRIRAQSSGDKATVRVLMSHEMESGQRKDASGKPCPPGLSRKSQPNTTAKMCSLLSGVPQCLKTLSCSSPSKVPKPVTRLL